MTAVKATADAYHCNPRRKRGPLSGNLKQCSMNRNGKILAALAAGMAVGAVLGVLFAPGKGSETRKKMKEEGRKMADDMKDKFNKGMEKLNEVKEGLKEKMEEFA